MVLFYQIEATLSLESVESTPEKTGVA